MNALFDVFKNEVFSKLRFFDEDISLINISA